MGNSYAIPGNKRKREELTPILYKLVEKTCKRMREENYQARGFSLNIKYRDGTCWKTHKTLQKHLDNTQEIYKIFYKLLLQRPKEKPVRILAESCFHLVKSKEKQLNLFNHDTKIKNQNLQKVVDKINQKFGDLTLKPAEILKAKNDVPDRVGFGK